MLKHLLPLIDNHPHTLYCEVFGGGGALLLAKAPSKNELINDINSDLVNAYLTVRDNPQGLLKELRTDFKSRQLLQHFNAVMGDKSATPVQRAAAFLYCNWFSFCADQSSFGVMRCDMRSRNNHLKKIAAASARLNRVTVECLDWRRCIELYDSPGTLFFLDPPYTVGKSKIYSLFTADDMCQLKHTLKKIKGSFILTVNKSVENCVCFEDFTQTVVSTAYSASKKTLTAKASPPQLIITP